MFPAAGGAGLHAMPMQPPALRQQAKPRQQLPTGVLVLDRVNGVAYVDISERADERLAAEWVDKLGYNKLVAFRSFDVRGKKVRPPLWGSWGCGGWVGLGCGWMGLGWVAHVAP